MLSHQKSPISSEALYRRESSPELQVHETPSIAGTPSFKQQDGESVTITRSSSLFNL
jgi:hypothetical protein